MHYPIRKVMMVDLVLYLISADTGPNHFSHYRIISNSF